jgi:hypothetical protein
MVDEWQGLLNFCKVRNIPLFALRWESTNRGSMVDDVMEHSDNAGLSGEFEGAEGWWDIMSYKTVSSTYTALSGFAKSGPKNFLAAR